MSLAGVALGDNNVVWTERWATTFDMTVFWEFSRGEDDSVLATEFTGFTDDKLRTAVSSLDQYDNLNKKNVTLTQLAYEIEGGYFIDDDMSTNMIEPAFVEFMTSEVPEMANNITEDVVSVTESVHPFLQRAGKTYFKIKVEGITTTETAKKVGKAMFEDAGLQAVMQEHGSSTEPDSTQMNVTLVAGMMLAKPCSNPGCKNEPAFEAPESTALAQQQLFREGQSSYTRIEVTVSGGGKKVLEKKEEERTANSGFRTGPILAAFFVMGLAALSN